MATEGWDLEGIPKPFWPHVRDFLVSRELYRLATQVSDRKVAKSLTTAAEGLLTNSARHLADPASLKG